MPLPGDQRRETAATTNPFAEQKPRVAEFTAKEIATLQTRLDKQLGPEYISTRPGAGGGKVHYLAAEKVINLANEVFGFNGWSSAIQNVQIDFVDENRENGKITLGLSTIVRVTLRDGTFHEDIGYGHIENCKGKAAAFEKAKKEAATDAMKRALRNFGNVLGNCLYDKDYLQKVTKVKIAPTKWDADNLHRHPDYAPIKREAIMDAETPRMDKDKDAAAQRTTSLQSGASFGSMEFEDDFGGNPFDEADLTHPDEVRVDANASARKANAAFMNGEQYQRQGMPRMQSMPQLRPSNVQPPQSIQGPQPPQQPSGPPRTLNNPAQHQNSRQPQAAQAQQQHGQPATGAIHNQAGGSSADTVANTESTSSNKQQQQQRQPVAAPQILPNGAQVDEPGLPTPRMPPPGIPEGFVTSRSVDLLNQPPGARPPNSSIAFNPHAETPSIRRTHGVNPGKSAPVTRSAINGTSAPNGHQLSQPQVAPAAGAPPPHPQSMQSNASHGAVAPQRTNYVNPSADMSRRIGMPPSAASHTMQNRANYKPPTPMKRPPLSDVSNMQQQMDGAGDVKKVKLDASDQSAVEIGDAQNVVVTAAATEAS